MGRSNSKTTKLLAVFTLTATTLCMSGCGLLDGGLLGEDATESTDQTKYPANEKYQDQKLLDDNGNEYTLHKNPDGTETAKYADGKEVTFRRDDNGNLAFISGTSGLLAGMAAGYFLFHGFNSPVGAWNSATNRYAVSEPLKPMSSASREIAMKKFTPAGTKIQDIKPPVPLKKEERRNSSIFGSGSSSSSNSNKNVSNSSSSSGSSSKSSVSSTKSGFGSAGARSASS